MEIKCNNSSFTTNIKNNYLLLDKGIKSDKLLNSPRHVHEMMYNSLPFLDTTKPYFI